MEKDVLECIRTRRSIRRYKTDQITDEELKKVLEAGTWAPTSKGQQKPFIVAVQKPALIEQLVKMNAEIMGVGSNPYYDAPTIILVFAPEDYGKGLQDGSCVLENMMLAAHAIGLGSCWINREIEMFQTEEGKRLMKEMNLPDGLMGIGALSIGYPAGFPPTVKARKEGYYRIIK